MRRTTPLLLLADALPDAFGNAWWTIGWPSRASSRRTSHRSVIASPAADRGMEALEFARRPRPMPASTAPVQLADLVLAARQTVRGDLGDDALAHGALEQLIQVGTSAGGARAKAVVAYNPACLAGASPYGPAPEGFEHWLIKLDGVGARGWTGAPTALRRQARPATGWSTPVTDGRGSGRGDGRVPAAGREPRGTS
ncbi:MAG: hypothetical protein R2694_15275 [Ilumatobacteraceae bacterium]